MKAGKIQEQLNMPEKFMLSAHSGRRTTMNFPIAKGINEVGLIKQGHCTSSAVISTYSDNIESHANSGLTQLSNQPCALNDKAINSLIQ